MGKPNIFDQLELEPRIFKNKSVFEVGHVPESLPFRDNEIRTIAQGIMPILRSDVPEDILIYGHSGSGKSAIISHLAKDLMGTNNESGRPYAMFADGRCNTEYRIIAKLTNSILPPFDDVIPQTGRPMKEVYEKFTNALSNYKAPLMIVLDNIEKYVTLDIEGLINNIKNSSKKSGKNVAIVGIADQEVPAVYLQNVFIEPQWTHVKFNSYTKTQLRTIIDQRIELGLHPNSIEDGAINKCVEFGLIRETGPKYAFELIKEAGSIASKNSKVIKENHIQEAHLKINSQQTEDLIDTLPIQDKYVLGGILGSMNGDVSTITGKAYDAYESITKNKIDTLTKRRFTDLIDELRDLGIIYSSLVSKGRYGRTKEMMLHMDKERLKQLLLQSVPNMFDGLKAHE